MEKNKIYFRNLSVPLKIAIITAWITFGIYCLSFLVGFIGGLNGY